MSPPSGVQLQWESAPLFYHCCFILVLFVDVSVMTRAGVPSAGHLVHARASPGHAKKLFTRVLGMISEAIQCEPRPTRLGIPVAGLFLGPRVA